MFSREKPAHNRETHCQQIQKAVLKLSSYLITMCILHFAV
ncbi:hypothetical protein BSS2_II0474 [Brucella suis bv. 1 str. S2]|uniref:Uncharacterized protein n=2 Tax=Brucella TaxID=234 RepID=Q577Q4_BRUAB|nr:hypothetical protein BRA0498 [Brucella suis 1330]AAX76130.1 hypothetical protein BruAb2_0724 [Brucella abortus bv. 1 str. 9-941]AEU07638.1 hypothetical protein BSVBI22_B0493 [Brucella suis VBI22]AHN48237.1 hypothetical protein BSS2_II0474 [Brucella suis bv. 1 str. S2]CDL78039.1 unnamed protein product [Brucella canis str. Oliveri]